MRLLLRLPGKIQSRRVPGAPAHDATLGAHPFLRDNLMRRQPPVITRQHWNALTAPASGPRSSTPTHRPARPSVVSQSAVGHLARRQAPPCIRSAISLAPAL
ncbi:hypothetical protein Micbo1qcDRAFT_159032, partial [Microdochium bolleyi]